MTQIGWINTDILNPNSAKQNKSVLVRFTRVIRVQKS